ncbi:MAG: chemotaxis protein CheW [Bacteroidetes bacterium]|nr:chemotaxis protein CheW [Bacteroidota bacterium]
MNEFQLENFTEKEQEILKKRARILSMKAEEEGKKLSEYLICSVSNEYYGFCTKFIQEVFLINQFTKLPDCPPWLKGIINLRGEIISVIDIREVFDLPKSNGNQNSLTLILHQHDIKFGILIDGIDDIIEVDENDIVKEFATFDDIRKEYLMGITNDSYCLLNAEKLLNDPRLIINNEF